MTGNEKVILDAGHGGDEPGAIYNGRKEKDDTLRLTLAVGRILEENGVSTLYTSGLRKRQRSPTGPERICLFPFTAMPCQCREQEAGHLYWYMRTPGQQQSWQKTF